MTKNLIIYFSRADENYNVGWIDKGNTEIIAEYIQEFTDADMFKIERKNDYPKDYYPCIEEAQQEIDNDERPELKNYLEDISDYDVIYIGAPVYWSYIPQPMVTQLEKLDFTGKTVRIFVTHEGSGLASIPSQIKRICKGANVKDDAIAIKGTTVKSAKSKIEQWI